MDTGRLKKMASSVYLAAPASVAQDISIGLTWAVVTIDSMQVQNEKLTEVIKALTEELAKMEEQNERDM